MGPAYYVIAILGCGEADAACTQVAVASSHYQSVDECNAATAAAVERHADIAFPVVVAQCKPGVGVLSDKIMPRDIDLPEASGKPQFRRASSPGKLSLARS